MFFDNARRNIVWDGIKDKVFLLKYECFKTDKELKQFVKQKAEREGLAEEDVDILVCSLLPGLIRNKVILADPYDSIPAITELLSGSEEELLVGGDLTEKMYPYACLLPDLKKRLKSSSLTLYIDKVPMSYDIGYVVFTGVGANLVSTTVLELSAVPPDFEENPFNYLHFFENERIQELKKQGNVVVIDSADKYSFQAIPFIPYQDYKKSVTKRNVLNTASLVLYVYALWQGVNIFSASRDIMMYTVEEAELSRKVTALQKKVEAYKRAIPNTEYIKDYIKSKQLEEKISQLPLYASMVAKKGNVKTYSKKKKYKRYILLDENFQGFYGEILKKFPDAEITREGYVLIPIE